MAKGYVLGAALLCVLSGCATKPTKPTATMSLERAICEVQNAIVRTQRLEHRAGLTPAEASVTLALGVKHTGGGELGAKLTLGIVEWGPKGSYSRESSQANTLTIKFVPGDTHFHGYPDSADVSSRGPESPLPDCVELFKEERTRVSS